MVYFGSRVLDFLRTTFLTLLLLLPISADGFGIGYIIKDHGVQFSVSSKHRQTLRYVNALENVLKDLKRLMNTTSSVVCHGHHHNHAIHPPAQPAVPLEREESGDYGDFWGENVLNSAANRTAATSTITDTVGKKIEDKDSGRLFVNIVRKDSMKLSEIKNFGVQLSFDESVQSVSSGASTDGRAWYYGSAHDSSLTNSEPGSI